MSETISEFLQRHRVEGAGSGNRHYRPGWVNVPCPWCGREDRNHLGFNLTAGYANCYSCGPKRLADALVAVCRIDLKTAIAFAKDYRTDRGPAEVTQRSGKYKPPKGIKRLRESKYHCDYIRDRRLDPRVLERVWNVGAISNGGDYAWRLFFPVLFDKEPVSWQTRTVRPDNKMPYLAAPPDREALPIKSLLYGEDFAGDRVLIVEGVFDVWTGGPGTVGTLGTGYTTAQFRRMTKYAKRYVCFDAEGPAQRRARKLVEDLAAFGGKTYNVILDAKDLNDARDRERALVRRTVFRRK